MIAISRIRPQPHYRAEAFTAGLAAAGYRVVTKGKPECSRDLLVLWNRYGSDERDADAWEAQGGTVLIAENGYVGTDGEGRQLYALSAHQHNGAGWWPSAEADRFPALGVTLQPWRIDGKHILVCGQRGIGSRLMASPAGWHDRAAARLRTMTKREVRVRLHPGNKPATVPLSDDLRDCWAVVVWSSGSGVKALASGIPVFYDAPHWIAENAANRFGCDVEFTNRSDIMRQEAFRRLSWAQWRVDEIAAGEPFIRFRSALLDAAA